MDYREEFEKKKCDKCENSVSVCYNVSKSIFYQCYSEFLEQQIEELKNQLCKKEEDEYKQDKEWLEEMIKKGNCEAIK